MKTAASELESKVIQMVTEDKLLHEIHKLKRRVSHLNSITVQPDSRLISEILEEIANALSEVHDEIAALKASSK